MLLFWHFIENTICVKLAASSVVVKLMDLDPRGRWFDPWCGQGRWFDPWCGQDKISTAVGPLR